MKSLLRPLGLGLAFTLVSFSTVSFSALAEVSVGKKAPAVTTPAEELVLENNEVIYRDWAPTELTGKLRVVYHLNAEMGVDAINKPFVDSLEALNLGVDVFSMLTVLNVADSSYFVKSIAQGNFESKREEYVESEFVWDEDAGLRHAWGLADEGSSITIVSKDGQVLAHKDGKLTAEEVQQFVAVIQDNLK
jgi:YtfJ family uncharacterized protein